MTDPETQKLRSIEVQGGALPPEVRQWLQHQGIELPPGSSVQVNVVAKDLATPSGVSGQIAGVTHSVREGIAGTGVEQASELSPAHRGLLQKICGLGQRLGALGVMDDQCRAALQKAEETAGKMEENDGRPLRSKVISVFDAFWELHVLVSKRLDALRGRQWDDPRIEQGQSVLREVSDALNGTLKEHNLGTRTFTHAREAGAEYRMWLDVTTEKKVLHTEGNLQMLTPALVDTKENRCLRRSRVIMS